MTLELFLQHFFNALTLVGVCGQLLLDIIGQLNTVAGGDGQLHVLLQGFLQRFQVGDKNGASLPADKPLLLQRFDCALEIGFGCDFYLPFFKLIPELKFCFGLVDLLVKDRSDLIDKNLLKYTQSLDGVSSRMVVLTLYFE